MALRPYLHLNVTEAGCDEAGRGCLSGPVFAGAVILPEDFSHPWLNDSKKISEKKRDVLRPIIEKEAIAWAVGSVSPEEIDEINILNASFLAMHRAIEQLTTVPELLLIDGNRFSPYLGIVHECIKFSINYDLPIIFVIEDNNLSVCTDTRKTWKQKKLSYEGIKNKKIIFYKYKNKYPHAGAGIRVQF